VDSLLALNAVGFAQWQHVALRTAEDPKAAWQEGMDAAMRGIAIARSNASQTLKAMLLGYAPSGGRWEEARIEAQIAVRLMERALRVNPRDPNAPMTHSKLAYAYFAAREYRKGLEWAMRAKNGAPGHSSAHQNMAVLLVGLGEIDRAKESLEIARGLEPKFMSHRLKARPADRGSELRHRYDTFLRIAAGLEDPGAADALR
jgi:tetratricopeptide (TPR) repeat protein